MVELRFKHLHEVGRSIFFGLEMSVVVRLPRQAHAITLSPPLSRFGDPRRLLRVL